MKQNNLLWKRLGIHTFISLIIFSYSLLSYKQAEAEIYMEVIYFFAGVIVTTIVSGLSYFGIGAIFVLLNEIGLKNKLIGMIDFSDSYSHNNLFIWLMFFTVNGLITYFLWGPFIFGVI